MSLYYTGWWWFDLHIPSPFSLHNIRLVSRIPHVSSWERFLNSLVTHSDIRSSTLSPCLIPEQIHTSFLQYWQVKGWKVCSLGNRSATVTLHRWLRVNPFRLLGAGNVGFDLFRAVSLQSQSRTCLYIDNLTSKSFSSALQARQLGQASPLLFFSFPKCSNYRWCQNWLMHWVITEIRFLIVKVMSLAWYEHQMMPQIVRFVEERCDVPS